MCRLKIWWHDFVQAVTPRPYPITEFGMAPMQFYIALLRACPPGSRLTFDACETESFAHAFHPWSHRSDPNRFEADEYTIDADFVALSEQLAARGALELEHHLGISGPDGRLLCASWDDFMVVKLADDLRDALHKSASAQGE
jgi:hypothetical protein